MTEAAKKAEEKPKCYFGIVPKEELPAFFERFKKALAEEKKGGEKKNLDIEIKTSKVEPKGFGIEAFTIDKAKYPEYFDGNAEHTKKAIALCTVNFSVKQESDIETLKATFEIIKAMFMELPPIKEKPGKYELHLRNNGTKCAIDLISVEGKIMQPLLDLGIDLADFHKFAFAFKTGLNLGKLYTDGEKLLEQKTISELGAEFLNILISLKSFSENYNYLCHALIAALKELKLNDEKLKKKLDDILAFIKLSTAFVSGAIKFEFDFGADDDDKNDKVSDKLGSMKEQVAQVRTQIQYLGTQMIKPAVEGMGFTNILKALNLDTISIAVGVPKYQNGAALVINLPGLSTILDDILK